jgi:flagellar motor switch protein FliM
VPEAILSEAEISALRSAMGQATTKAADPRRVSEREATPIALIADDRIGERVRPAAFRLLSRWAPLVRTRLQRGLGIKIELHPSTAEIVPGSLQRDEIAASWKAALEVAGRPGLGLVSVSGPWIETIAARMLGDSPQLEASGTGQSEDRAPSATALSVFSRVGEVIVSALSAAWHEEEKIAANGIADPRAIEELRFRLSESEGVLVATLDVTKPASGRVRLCARPDLLIAPPPPVQIAALTAEEIDAALGDVPIEVLVELGRARMRMSDLRTFSVGTMLTLDQPTDALLPVRCKGVIKAFGRPAVSRGAIAVQIVSGPGRGSKST